MSDIDIVKASILNECAYRLFTIYSDGGQCTDKFSHYFHEIGKVAEIGWPSVMHLSWC